jgi:hypothetical protein
MFIISNSHSFDYSCCEKNESCVIAFWTKCTQSIHNYQKNFFDYNKQIEKPWLKSIERAFILVK